MTRRNVTTHGVPKRPLLFDSSVIATLQSNVKMQGVLFDDLRHRWERIVLGDREHGEIAPLSELADAVEKGPGELARRARRLEERVQGLAAGDPSRLAFLVPKRDGRKRHSGVEGHLPIIDSARRNIPESGVQS